MKPSSNIPQPRKWPVLGNVLDVDPVNWMGSLDRLADRYGEIYRLELFDNDTYVVSSVDLVEEVCDETRFRKKIDDALLESREVVKDGLFTAHSDEPNWGAAHRVLTPAFGPLPIKEMFDEMYDIASQLVSKWARSGPDYAIPLTDDMTRLTLDSISLCAMDMRFNSFYHEELHPFVEAMGGVLIESGRRANRTKIEALLNPGFERQFRKDIATLRTIAQECIDRRKTGTPKKDLLDAMLNGKDPKTGQRLSEETVMNNMITFLIAGHETTSGLLSFTIYYLLKNPEALQRAQQEVDTVIGSGQITFRHMSKLPYIEAALRESIRLSPPAAAITVTPVTDGDRPAVIGGKYVIPPDASIAVLLSKSQRDPAVFGEDANEYKPERMLDEKFRNLRSGAWKPFGNGARACIGRPFAWQEAILALALILQNFNLRLADPSYELKVVMTLTQKPTDLNIKATLRDGIEPVGLQKRLYGSSAPTSDDKITAVATFKDSGSTDNAAPLTILVGSTAGTCEGLAQALASSARGRGFKPTVQSLDAAVDKLPKDQPIVIITASYEGQPPDNAKIFVQWLKSVDAAKISGTKFAVFGCGHRDWASTYQRVPQLIQEELVSKGAITLTERGETDVSQGTIFDDFDAWMDALWLSLPTNGTPNEDTDAFTLDISTTSRASHLHYKVQQAKVITNDRLTSPNATSEKRHLTLQLPTGMNYTTGDYLAVLPMNSSEIVSRVLRRFSLPWDAVMTLTSGSHATIPKNQQLPIASVLASYVELNTPATKRQKQILAAHSTSPLNLTENTTILSILESNPTLPLPFPTFLSLLPPLRLRQYSISSSPLANPSLSSITFSLHSSGTATTYLSNLVPGSTLQISIKPASKTFRLPLDDKTPIILACAGTGIAPFRAFIQERALKKEAGKKEIGEIVLFFGCREPLFQTELNQWEKDGVVRTFYAGHDSGYKYVQDRIWAQRDLVSELFDQGSRVYVCGSRAVGQGIREVAEKIYNHEKESKGENCEEGDSKKWWDGLRGERVSVDVFD